MEKALFAGELPRAWLEKANSSKHSRYFGLTCDIKSLGYCVDSDHAPMSRFPATSREGRARPMHTWTAPASEIALVASGWSGCDQRLVATRRVCALLLLLLA